MEGARRIDASLGRRRRSSESSSSSSSSSARFHSSTKEGSAARVRGPIFKKTLSPSLFFFPSFSLVSSSLFISRDVLIEGAEDVSGRRVVARIEDPSEVGAVGLYLFLSRERQVRFFPLIIFRSLKELERKKVFFTFAHPTEVVLFQMSWLQCPVAEDHEGLEKSICAHSAAQAPNASLHVA